MIFTIFLAWSQQDCGKMNHETDQEAQSVWQDLCDRGHTIRLGNWEYLSLKKYRPIFQFVVYGFSRRLVGRKFWIENNTSSENLHIFQQTQWGKVDIVRKYPEGPTPNSGGRLDGSTLNLQLSITHWTGGETGVPIDSWYYVLLPTVFFLSSK